MHAYMYVCFMHTYMYVCYISLFSSLLIVLLCKDIFVSLASGNDFVYCGRFNQPCKTIDFTFKEIIRNNDVIILDGGKNEVLSYELTETINITISFKLIKFNENEMTPVISTTSLSTPAFQFVSKYNCSCSFVSVNFENSTVVHFLSRGNIFINNCVIRESIIFTKTLPIFHAMVNIFGSKLYGNQLIALEFASNVTLIINDSYVTGAISFKKTNCTFRFINSVFESLKLQMEHANVDNWQVISHITECIFRQSEIYTQGNGYAVLNKTIFNNTSVFIRLKDVNINQCTFHGSYRLESLDTPRVLLRGCEFKGFDISRPHTPAVIFLFSKKLYIDKCLFIDNGINTKSSENTLAIGEVESAMLTQNIFKNNTAYHGGAIYIHQSKVNISDSLFLYNYAARFGGTLYIVGGDSFVHLKNVEIYGPRNEIYPDMIGQIIYCVSKVSLENVSVVVDHSTAYKPIIYGDYITFRSPFSMTCPMGNNARVSFENPKVGKHEAVFKYSSYCVPCGKEKYNLTKGRLYANGNSQLESNVSCSSCPPAGICDSSITSTGNYWGYKRDHTIQFIPCIVNYCCSNYGTPCKSYDTCEKNRCGRLCGSCMKNFSLSLFSTMCIDNSKCTLLTSVLYWSFHVIFALIYTCCLMYIKEIGLFFKRLMVAKSATDVVESDTLTTPLLITSSYNSPEIETNLLGNQTEIEFVTIGHPSHNRFEENSKEYVKTKKLISGLLKITFFYYQVASLLKVNTSANGKYKYRSWLIQSIVTSIFNVKINAKSNGLGFCPIAGLNTIGKVVLKISFLLTMFLILFILYNLNYLLRWWNSEYRSVKNEGGHEFDNAMELDESIPAYSSMPFPLRIKCCLIKLSLVGYMTISIFLFKCINCVSIGKSVYLYIQGDIECYKNWQLLIGGIIILWVLPFCLSLYYGSRLLYQCKLSPNAFLSTLCFPPAILFYYARSKLQENIGLSRIEAMTAKHFLIILYEPFRINSTNGRPVLWEVVLIIRKLILVLAYTFIIHPIGKLYALNLLLLTFLFHHVKVQPYNDSFLNLVETGSILLLCLLTSMNIFWAQIYMTNATNFPNFDNIEEAFLLLEMLMLVLPILLFILLVFIRIMIRIASIYKKHIHKQE